jgi:hypothetical protein
MTGLAHVSARLNKWVFLDVSAEAAIYLQLKFGKFQLYKGR